MKNQANKGIVAGSLESYLGLCASFLSVLIENVNLVSDAVNILRIILFIVKSIANKVINQIPLRFCKQLTVNALGELVCHEWLPQEQM